MSDTIPLSDGRFLTTQYNKVTDELTLIIKTAEGEVLLGVVLAMDDARELAYWLIEGYVQDLDLTPEKIINARPELN